MKTCPGCKGHGPFGIEKRTFDGLTARCMACRNKYGRDWKKAHPDQGRSDAAKRWREENPERQFFLMKRHALKMKHGMTPEQWEAMWLAQDGRCEICCDPIGGFRDRGGKTHVDHDHATGLIRGLLCELCNRGLGHFKDDPERLLKARDYLLAKRPKP